jgi:hypothetical protein
MFNIADGDRAHSFVVRVWKEEGTPHVRWRGHVTNVATGDRQHFEQLDVICTFIAHFLNGDVKKPKGFWRSSVVNLRRLVERFRQPRNKFVCQEQATLSLD